MQRASKRSGLTNSFIRLRSSIMQSPFYRLFDICSIFLFNLCAKILLTFFNTITAKRALQIKMILLILHRKNRKRKEGTC
jgi:hypothetical protein